MGHLLKILSDQPLFQRGNLQIPQFDQVRYLIMHAGHVTLTYIFVFCFLGEAHALEIFLQCKWLQEIKILIKVIIFSNTNDIL